MVYYSKIILSTYLFKLITFNYFTNCKVQKAQISTKVLKMANKSNFIKVPERWVAFRVKHLPSVNSMGNSLVVSSTVLFLDFFFSPFFCHRVRWPGWPRTEIIEETFKQTCICLAQMGQNPTAAPAFSVEPNSMKKTSIFLISQRHLNPCKTEYSYLYINIHINKQLICICMCFLDYDLNLKYFCLLVVKEISKTLQA